MSPTRLTKVISGAAFALLLGTAAAAAAPAYASATVNVRAGAGTGYAVIDVLRPGDPVDIDHCRGTWCLVNTGSGDGWVSARYLAADRGGYDNGSDDGYADRDYYDEPDLIVRPRPYYRPYRSFGGPYGGFYGGPWFGSSVCAGGPNMSFCFGN